MPDLLIEFITEIVIFYVLMSEFGSFKNSAAALKQT